MSNHIQSITGNQLKKFVDKMSDKKIGDVVVCKGFIFWGEYFNLPKSGTVVSLWPCTIKIENHACPLCGESLFISTIDPMGVYAFCANPSCIEQESNYTKLIGRKRWEEGLFGVSKTALPKKPSFYREVI